MSPRLVAIVAGAVYGLAALVSDGLTLWWTLQGLAWVWGLAPVPMTILMVIIPGLFVVAIMVSQDLMPMRKRPKREDLRRLNPPEPVVRRPRQPDKPPEPPIEPVTQPIDLDKVIEQPNPKCYTVDKKPPQPKIWGIDP